MPTEAHKRASKKWDAVNMTNLSIKVRRTYADQIKTAAAKAGTTPAAIMRQAIDKFMQDHQEETQTEE